MRIYLLFDILFYVLIFTGHTFFVTLFETKDTQISIRFKHIVEVAERHVY